MDAFQNDMGEHSPLIQKIGYFRYSPYPPMLLSPAMSVRKAGCTHRAQSQPLDHSLIVLLQSQEHSSFPLTFSFISPLSWHLQPIPQLLRITHSTNLSLCHRTGVVGTNLVSRSGRPGLESQLYNLLPVPP